MCAATAGSDSNPNPAVTGDRVRCAFCGHRHDAHAHHRAGANCSHEHCPCPCFRLIFWPDLYWAAHYTVLGVVDRAHLAAWAVLTALRGFLTDHR